MLVFSHWLVTSIGLLVVTHEDVVDNSANMQRERGWRERGRERDRDSERARETVR